MCPTNISCTSCKILLSSYKEDIIFFFFSFFFQHLARTNHWLGGSFWGKQWDKTMPFCETCQSTKDAWDVFFLCCFCQQEVLLLGTTITCTVLALRNLCLLLRAGSCPCLSSWHGQGSAHPGALPSPGCPSPSTLIPVNKSRSQVLQWLLGSHRSGPTFRMLTLWITSFLKITILFFFPSEGLKYGSAVQCRQQSVAPRCKYSRPRLWCAQVCFVSL